MLGGLNAPYGAPCFLTPIGELRHADVRGLNAPYGARCFLTKNDIAVIAIPYTGLNAPYGAWCFLTLKILTLCISVRVPSLNAPYGARCFLTIRARRRLGRGEGVLMHLMVLGAF